ncbi:MAG: tripartite tricarboxylate transporter TctB family protein [Burkholderiales bacterium]|nr:tripartite tricarboxylate transporter TctB family protein [Burkholderiales bacterium]MDE2396647.1 tripartite tricarboxylate transporter TctB family protein [Burkholderiales bacterium]MDE2457515.1 tripartite tricarboxylate transporter TctB family protein [Burkholderiales bacterium]
MVLLGTAVGVQGAGYHVGSLTHMGAGFMPVVYGTLMVVVGLLIAATARRGPDPKGKPAEWRGWACILGGVAAFVVLGKYGGLIPAAFASVFISALGDRNNTVRQAALLGVAITLLGWLIFSVGLSLPLQPFAWG